MAEFQLCMEMIFRNSHKLKNIDLNIESSIKLVLKDQMIQQICNENTLQNLKEAVLSFSKHITVLFYNQQKMPNLFTICEEYV